MLDQTEEIGYDSPNSIVNLKSLAILLMFYIIALLLFPLIKLLQLVAYRNKYVNQVYQIWFKRLFFNEILMIMIEGYIEFIIAAFLNVFVHQPLNA